MLIEGLCKNVASDDASFRRNLPLEEEFCMKTKRFSVEQIVAVLKEAGAGMRVALIHRIGVRQE